MKLLITTDLFTTETNGVATSVRNLWEELKNKGHDVRILTLSDTPHSYTNGSVVYIRSVPIGIIYPGVRMPIPFHHPLIQELIEWKPDVIHSQCEFFSFQYALRISKITHAPIVHTYHTLYEQYVAYVFPSKDLGARAVRFLSRKRLKRVNHLIAPTNKVANTLRDYGLTNAMSVVPSGICLEQHRQPLPADVRRAKRQELGIRDDQLVLLSLGRLGTEKNVDELLKLFAMAAERSDHLFFLIVGDGPAREDLEKLAKDLGISNRVTFTGMVPSAQVQNYYRLGDVFVSASTSETQGLTYIEAAANGLPLLCRQDPCLQDVLLYGENGYTYTTASEFLDAIAAMEKYPQWRLNAAKRGEEIAASYDKSAFGDSVEAIYKSIIS